MIKTTTLGLNADGRRNQEIDRTGATWIQRVDDSSRWRSASVFAPVLALDAPSWVPSVGVPGWAKWAGVILVLAAIWWAARERSASGTQRRAKRTSNRVAGGAGLVALGILGAIQGTLDAALAVLGSTGDVLFAHPTALVELGIAGIGYAALDGAVALGADTFALIAGVVILLGIMARN